MQKHFSVKHFFVLGLIVLALGERLWFDLGPNVELVTLATFLAAFYIGKKAALIVPLVTLAISDIFLGNTSIMLFTWSAYGVIALGAVFIRRLPKRLWTRISVATGGGVVASLWFYVWTNFGVWLLDSWGMYPKTFVGLIVCYINGLPFLRNQLGGNLLLIPLGFGMVEILKAINAGFRIHFRPRFS